MDKDKLTARLELIEREREQLKTMIAAYDGAAQETKYWLSQLDVKPVEQKSEEA